MVAGLKPVLGNADTSETSGDSLLTLLPPWGLIIFRYAVTFALTATATVLAVGFDNDVAIPNLSLIFVLPVVVAGVSFGLGPSLFSSVLGALAYNFFLTDPRYTLRVDDPANVWAIALLFVVGCIASAVASISRRKAEELALRDRQVGVIGSFSRDVLAAGDPKAMASATARTLAGLFSASAVVVRVVGEKAELMAAAGSIEPQKAEFDAARFLLTTGAIMRAGIYPTDASRFDFWPVAAQMDQSVVVGLAFDADERPSQVDVQVEIIAGLLALALDRHRLKPAGDT